MEGGDFSYSIQVPVGSKGFVHINGTKVEEGGKPIRSGAKGIVSVEKGDGKTIVEVGSGEYEFQAKLS